MFAVVGGELCCGHKVKISVNISRLAVITGGVCILVSIASGYMAFCGRQLIKMGSNSVVDMFHQPGSASTTFVSYDAHKCVLVRMKTKEWLLTQDTFNIFLTSYCDMISFQPSAQKFQCHICLLNYYG